MADPLPFQRWWVAQFSADTAHLSPAQVGNHVRLLMLAWRRASCSIPADPEWICRRLNIGRHEYARDVAPALADLWESDGEDYHNSAQREERFHCEERSAQAKQAALIRHHGDNIHSLKIKGKT
jgi:uncharacterized protein YdaU (DUF1376 family)